jgi:hypothetical protein
VLGRAEGRHQTLYLDDALPDLGVFYYRVASIDAAGGVGDPSGAQRAVTKGEPLPPTGLRVASQTIGANTLEWNANVEPDLRGYQLLRLREGDDEAELVAEVHASQARATDTAVVPGERVRYRVVARDADELRSPPSDPIEIVGADYDLRAVATPSGVSLRWNPIVQASFRETRVLRDGDEIARATRAELEDPRGERGDRYQLVGIRADASESPASKSIEAE